MYSFFFLSFPLMFSASPPPSANKKKKKKKHCPELTEGLTHFGVQINAAIRSCSVSPTRLENKEHEC